MSITGSSLAQRIQILRLGYDEETNACAWEEDHWTWAAAEQDTRSNLFSAVGVGARGITFTIRKSSRLTLHHAFRWRGRFCFLTAIMDGDPGFQVVKAALCEPVPCAAVPQRRVLGPGNRPQLAEGTKLSFPGVLTEKYVRYGQEDTYARTETAYVLVTPKQISLDAGALVTVHEGPAAGLYNLLACHVLDEFKNEYEITRRRDV